MLKGKKVFVSGGSGVIGRVLVERLHKLGAIVFVGDLKPRPSIFPNEVIYRQGDLNYITKEELDYFAPEIFFHLAATFERTIEAYDFWDENYHHNIRLSHHLMSCLKDSNYLKRVVFASSYLIYNPELYSFEKPAEKVVRLKENDAIYPRNICGAAKLLHEVELRFLNNFKASEFSTVCARIFRVYGKNSRDVISRWVRDLLQEREIEVFKKEGLFDYIYADEAAEGLIRLAISDATGIVNLGNDNARRIEEVIHILSQYFPEMKMGNIKSDIHYEASQANMDLFEKITNWRPKLQLEDAIPEIIEYEKNKKHIEEASSANLNILVTSISRKVSLIKSLRKASLKLGNGGRIIGADSDDKCIARCFVDEFWHMPLFKDLNINNLIEFCRKNSVSCIVPTRDGELAFFAQHKKQLMQNGIYTMISNQEAVDVCIDKLKFYKKLKSLGFPVIETSTDIGEINYESYVVKERMGAGSKTILLNCSKEEAFEHASKLKDPIFQPYIKGKEFSVDLYIAKNEKTKGAVVRSRELVINGESQITVTLRNEILEKLFSELAEQLELYGHIILQVLIDEAENFHIIECNSRFGGASSLSLEVGLDSFYWFLLEAQGQDLKEYPFLRSKKEKKQIRYSEDLII